MRQHCIVLVVVPQICWFLPSGLKAYMQSICCVHSLACCSSQQLGCGVLRISWDGRSHVIYLHQSVFAPCTAVCCSYFYPSLFHGVHYHRCSSHRLLLYNPALLLSKLSVLCSSCPFPFPSVCLTLWIEHTLFRTKYPNEIVLAHGLPILDTFLSSQSLPKLAGRVQGFYKYLCGDDVRPCLAFCSRKEMNCYLYFFSRLTLADS